MGIGFIDDECMDRRAIFEFFTILLRSELWMKGGKSMINIDRRFSA